MFPVRSNRLKAAFAVVALACLGAPLARAETTLPAGPVTLLEHTQLVGGGFASVLDFLVPAAGTVSVVLKDLVWPDTLSGLSFAAVSTTSMLASLSAPGSLTFDVTAPGHFFAIVSGNTQGDLNLGLYSVSLQWNAVASAASSVPLPAAGWLLVSGAAGLIGFARRRGFVIKERAATV